VGWCDVAIRKKLFSPRAREKIEVAEKNMENLKK
jgi:hypothetical protein